MIEIQLSELYRLHYGYSPDQKIQIDDEDWNAKRWQGDSKDKWYKIDPKSANGKRIFMPVTFKWVGAELFLPYCWMQITGGKYIVETRFTERRGSVKEIISEEELSINIQGFVFNRDGSFPETDVERLKALWAVNEPVEIDCPLTDIFLLTNEQNIRDRVLIKDFTLKPDKGVEHVKGFEMNLVSDADLELEIP